MANYKNYPKSSDTPNRKSRKGMRRTVFLANKKMTKKAERRAQTR
jgi:hypothetical protein